MRGFFLGPKAKRDELGDTGGVGGKGTGGKREGCNWQEL